MTNNAGGSNQSANKLRDEIRKLVGDAAFGEELDGVTNQILETVKSSLPGEATADFEYFDEDSTKGWTPEQLKERVWGYNTALKDIKKLLEGGD